MSRMRFTAEQIIGLLREADVKLSQGRNVVHIPGTAHVAQIAFVAAKK